MNENLGKLIAVVIALIGLLAGWTYSINAEIAATHAYIVAHDRMHQMEHDVMLRERQLEEQSCMAFREAVRRDIERLFTLIERIANKEGVNHVEEPAGVDGWEKIRLLPVERDRDHSPADA